MASSHRGVFHFVVIIIVLYIGVVVSMNCDNSSVSPVVPFCSDVSVTGRVIYLSGIDNGTNGAGCNCFFRLTFPNQQFVKIGIKNATTASKPCDYLLYSVFKHNSTILYSCRQTVQIESFDLQPMETVKLHMQKGTYNGVGFPFCLELDIEQGSAMTLQCTTKSTTTTASPTSLTSMKSASRHNRPLTIPKTNSMPTSSTSGNDDTIATLSTTLNSSTWGYEGASEATLASKSSDMTRPTTESQPANDDSDRLIGIIIGSIVGVLVVVALVIVIICLVKRRTTKPQYETPMENQDRPHSYVNAAVTSNNNANDLNDQIAKPGNQEMIYLENDLYKSIDDDVPVRRKGGNHEGMIYLENDLYISNNETDDVHQDAENSVPHQSVEYAVVNKTAKKSSSGNRASMGHTVGPHGDEYTVVQKKQL